MKRLRAVPAWLPAAIASLAVYWPALGAWFYADDFAWLGLRRLATGLPGLGRALFEPMAQGTIRPLSERAFFLAFSSLFGWNAVPYHAWVLLTELATLPLLAAIARRLTGSAVAAWLAPLFWAVNTGLGRSMGWASAYNQVLCVFFLALAFWSLLKREETGQRRYAVLEWAAFLGGLGALETAAVYPLLVLVYLGWALPPVRVLAQLAVSAAWIAFRLWAAPATTQYALHYDLGIFTTLWRYWADALGPARLPIFMGGLPRGAAMAATAALSAALLIALAGQRRDRRALVGPAWMLLALAPVLPLREHRMDYYLTVPAAGLGLWGAAAFAGAIRRNRLWRCCAAACAAVYVSIGALGAHRGVCWVRAQTRDARVIVEGAAEARRRHPGGAIVLAGLSDEQYRNTFYNEPFPLLGLRDVYVGPDVAARVKKTPGDKPLSRFMIPEQPLLAALAGQEAWVYRAAPGRLQNVTAEYFARGRGEWDGIEPRWVDVGNPWYSRQLDKGWYNIHLGHRWMGKRAGVRLGGPSGPGARLLVSGWCPAAQVRSGPLAIRFSLDVIPVGNITVREPDSVFEAAFPIPAVLNEKRSVIVTVEVERTYSAPPDARNLGVVFGIFEIRN